MTIIIILAAKYLFIVSIVIAGIYFLRIGKNKKISMIKVALITFPLAYLIAKILGHIFYNPRPFVVEHLKPLIAHAANNGFPSDHTLLTMAIASVLFLSNRTIGSILAVIAVCVGFARVAALIHHPIDIFGSTLIAIGSTFIAFVILRHFKQFS